MVDSQAEIPARTGAKRPSHERAAVAAGAIAAVVAAAVALGPGAAAALAHPIVPVPAPVEAGGDDASGLATAWAFSGYGVKHIVLGYDHLLFLGGLAILSTRLRDLVGIAILFALAYSATLIGATLAGLTIPGDVIDAVIALSVGFVGLQIAFGSRDGGRLTDDPRPAALCFGLAHGLGLSSLLQELRLPGDELLPATLGFNAGVEIGQLAALVVFIAILAAVRGFPFPARQRLPAGFALVSAATFLLAFVVLGVSL